MSALEERVECSGRLMVEGTGRVVHDGVTSYKLLIYPYSNSAGTGQKVREREENGLHSTDSFTYHSFPCEIGDA